MPCLVICENRCDIVLRKFDISVVERFTAWIIKLQLFENDCIIGACEEYIIFWTFLLRICF